MKEKKNDKIENVKELTDEEVENAVGGMKIVLADQPKFLWPLLRLLFKIKS